MKIFIGSDHAGYSLKESLKSRLAVFGEVSDCGTNSTESCDYPVFANDVATKVLNTEGSLGILICGTGVGMAIAANKVKGIRAASVSEQVSARMSREHNNAQILCLGARVIDEEKAFECCRAFFEARFDETHPRHLRRLQLITQIEQENS